MTDKNIYSRMQQKHDVQANWEKAVNFTPLVGEIIIYDPDENNLKSRIKIGDGKTNVNNLTFIGNEEALLYSEQTLTEAQKAQARENIGALEPLVGSTDNITPSQVSEALREGRSIVISYTDSTYGIMYFTGFLEVPALNTVESSGVSPYYDGNQLMTMRFTLEGAITDGDWYFRYGQLADYSDIPSTLPNPNALTFNGAVTGTYDGSSPTTITIPTIAGKDGTSVTVASVSESSADGGSNVVTFSDGKTLTVKNGSKGSKGDKGDKGDTGAQGPAGKTPVKGTDYWTAADQASMVQQVIAALPDASEVSY